MVDRVALQNVVVEHKRALASAIGAELTKQVRELGMPDARVWISFDGAGAGAVVVERGARKRGGPKGAKAAKGGQVNKAEKKAFYMCNYWRKKKGLEPLTFEAWKATKANPEKN
jgi:hypothetical protein